MYNQRKNTPNIVITFANLLKRVHRTVFSWDFRCVMWAKNRRLPAWIGHIPIFTIMLISIVGLMVGGVIIASIIIFIWSVAFIFQSIGREGVTDEGDSVSTGAGYRDGQEGYGYYSGSDDVTSDRLD